MFIFLDLGKRKTIKKSGVFWNKSGVFLNIWGIWITGCINISISVISPLFFLVGEKDKTEITVIPQCLNTSRFLKNIFIFTTFFLQCYKKNFIM